MILGGKTDKNCTTRQHLAWLVSGYCIAATCRALHHIMHFSIITGLFSKTMESKKVLEEILVVCVKVGQ